MTLPLPILSLVWPARSIDHSGRTFLEHLVGTYDVLRCWDIPEEVCFAGLIHSIYSTQYFSSGLYALDGRLLVREAVGERAERLAYLFCVSDRAHIHDLANEGQWHDRTIHLRGLEDKQWNLVSAAEVESLIAIEAANIAEQACDRENGPVPWMEHISSWAASLRHLRLPYSRAGAINRKHEELLISLYTKSLLAVDSSAANVFMDELLSLKPLSAEPYIAGAFLALESGDFVGSAELAVNGRERMRRWGTPWDKRLTIHEWLTFAAAITDVALREEKCTLSWSTWSTALRQRRALLPDAHQL